MLRPRIIPCLLLHGDGLVKTRRFSDPKYVGDPLNAVRIFNEKEVDELLVLGIDRTVEGREPDFSLIRDLASECRMPLCYGGGVKTVAQVERLVSLGVEKVAMSSAFLEDPDIVRRSTAVVGRQSVAVVLDVRADWRGRATVWTHRGTRKTGRSPVEAAKRAEDAGAGEIVVNSIDRDGMMEGYDVPLVRKVREALSVPITVLGGAGSLRDIAELASSFGAIGAAAGSLFVFKGKYRAVLINYPTRSEKDALWTDFSPSEVTGEAART